MNLLRTPTMSLYLGRTVRIDMTIRDSGISSDQHMWRYRERIY